VRIIFGENFDFEQGFAGALSGLTPASGHIAEYSFISAEDHTFLKAHLRRFFVRNKCRLNGHYCANSTDK
jgi:hypothetical protein